MKKSELDKSAAEYKEGTRLIVVMTVIGLLFLWLVGYLTYLEIFAKDAFIDNAFNQRQWKQEQNTLRGQITDRDGEVLAYSEKAEKGQDRIYPYGSMYAHLIGYNSKIYGKSQLELAYNKNLAGLSPLSGISELADKLQGEEQMGDTLQLTVSHRLQAKAAAMLGSRNGSVVAVNPKTGEVLCMVDYPSFDPSAKNLSDHWEELTSDENAPFLSRATSGLYAPGSTFKTVIAAAAIENGLADFETEDEGSVVVDGKTFTNTQEHVYGHLDLTRAYAVSSNVAFIELGLQLGETPIRTYAQAFKIGEKIPFELPVEPSRMTYRGNMSQTDIASLSIGQGKLSVTPLQMALVTAAVANNGVLNKPYLVEKVVNSTGIVVENGRTQTWARVMKASTAAKLKEMMVEAVENGTGSAARVAGVTVGGKTGTAENEQDKEHVWFIGFAPAEDPTIAVAVMLENTGGTGGGECAPIAAEVIKAWLS